MENPNSSGVVLVVDDAPSTLRMLCDALAGEGYTVIVARDATEAMRRLEMTVPDAILLDGVMPGEDGFSLCRRIKAEPMWVHIPILFMTGLAETEQVLKGFASGGVDYVVKPIKIPEVLARLATHVRNATISRMARQAIDVAGFGVVLLDQLGRIAWCSPSALTLIEMALGPSVDDPSRRVWLQGVIKAGTTSVPIEANGGQLIARHMGSVGLGETMILLSQDLSNTDPDHRRLAEASLTPRETEVLSWLAKGKTNKDIGDILAMSPRTVAKHLEHIFEKLGVETRSAAAAIGSNLL